jgi:hypothetical protein
LTVPVGVLRYVPENLPEVDAVMPLRLLVLFAISPVVSPPTRPIAVNPLIVLVVPSNSVDPDRPVMVALALLMLAVSPVG